MPLKYRLKDLSPSQQEQVMRQLSPTRFAAKCKSATPDNRTKKNTTAQCVEVGSLPTAGNASGTDLTLVPFVPTEISRPCQVNLREDKMSSTESAYLRDVLHGNGLFEGITFKSPSGNRYTPDFITIINGKPTAIEIKGSFRLGSEARAHTAFMEAASNFSCIFQFLWVQREKGGAWTTKIAVPASSSTSTETSTSTTSI